ncbi:hypothetical protein [Azospirillum sp.]|uniref:hypothetical protein n=1 Tax=Azospirillum sp. TaxID=34012 RepID=UPI002D27C86C|nr:hypothetical protein [Azospirillum sp.]HYD71383.1 hypothetical protein [Azospirillum sp.]
MSIVGVGGYTVHNQPAARNAGDAKAPASPAAPSGPASTGPVDTVDLSPTAAVFANFSGPVKLNLDGGIRGNAGLLAAAGVKMERPAVAEESAARKEITDYAGKLNALVSETFGLTAEQDGWGAGGAAVAMIDKLAEKNGLAKPKAMAGDGAAGAGGGSVGTLDIALGAKDGEAGGSVRILFDANAKPAANGPLLDLSGADGQGVLSMLKDSALGKALEQSGWSPNGTKKAFAATSGDGADARVSALFVTDGKDGYVKDNANTLLGTIRGLLG